MSNSQRRNSEGVVTRVHPRTDFPQQGWIRKATVNGTAQDFYEAKDDFGWFAQTQCFRMPSRRLRSNKDYDVRWRARSKGFLVLAPEPVVYDPATVDWHVFGDMTPKRSFQWRPIEPCQDVWTATIPVVYDPAVSNDWYVHGDMVPRRKHLRWRPTEPAQALHLNPNLYDTATRWAAIAEKNIPRPPRPRNIAWRPTEPAQSTWLNHNLFDRATEFPATQQLLPRDSRAPKARTLGWRPVEPAQNTWLDPNQYGTAERWAAIQAKETPRMAKGKRWFTSDPKELEFLYQSVLLDPTVMTWDIPHILVPGRKWFTSDPKELEFLYQSVLLDPTVFTWDIPSFITKKNTRRPLLGGDMDSAWIFDFVNSQAGFDPALYAAFAMYSYDRVSKRTMQSVLSQAFYDYSWLRDVLSLPDPPSGVDDYLFYYHYRRHRSLDAIAKKKVIAKKRRRRR